jgi:hypothetical protein
MAKRDYKAEYQSRIAKGLARGLSRSEARGHAQPKAFVYNKRLEEGLKAVRKGDSLTKAARTIRAAPETLRKYIKQTGVATQRAKHIHIGSDSRIREIQFFSGGREFTLRVQGYNVAAKIGSYMSAVKQFLATNDTSFLEPFAGNSIVDVKGKRYPFETRPNVLYRLTASSTDSFEEVYKIVA